MQERSPHPWLTHTPLLDLEDPKLRLRVHALTQFSKNEREKALVLHAFVKRVPLARPLKLRPRTAREVLDWGRGDAHDKSTLLVAMFRTAGLPARVHYIGLRGDILRGLVGSLRQPVRPVVEVCLGGRWVRTDTHLFDANYMAAARQRLKEKEWDWGYGIHVRGAATWDGRSDAFVGGEPGPDNPMVDQDFGVWHDALDFITSQAWRSRHLRTARMLNWDVLTPLMQWSIRRLRQSSPVPGRRSS